MFKFTFTKVPVDALPKEWRERNADYISALSGIASVEVVNEGRQVRAPFMVAKYRAEWWVWFPSGKMWSGYGTSRDRALQEAIASAWLYA